MRVFKRIAVVNPLNGVVIIIDCETILVKEVGSQNDVISTVLVKDVRPMRIKRDVAIEFWKTNVTEHECFGRCFLPPKV